MLRLGDWVANSIQNADRDADLTQVMDTAGTVMGKAVGKFTGVGVEAGVNYLLMRRLGRTTVSYLRPLAT